MKHRPELAFFNRLSAILRIELTEPAQQVSPHLLDLAASPSAELVSLRVETNVFEGDDERPLTEEELASVAFDAPEIQLRGDTGELVVHRAPNGRHFKVGDLIRAVEETERRTRANTEWLGGIDVHHIFFEGILPEQDGTWSLCWGS